MGAKTLCRGAGHVIVAIDDELARLAQGLDVVGLPAREAFPDFPEVHEVMDRVYRTGVAVTIPDVVNTLGEPGVNVIEPVFRDGRVWGVVSDWLPAPSVRPPIGAGAPVQGRAPQPTR